MFQIVGLGANTGLDLSSAAAADSFKFIIGLSTPAAMELISLTGTGNLWTGTNNPSTNILQVGNAGRLKIGSGTTNYSLIRTLDADGVLNTRVVVVSGNT